MKNIVDNKFIKLFKDHIPYVENHGSITTLDWRKPGTRYSRIKYIFDEDKLMVHGDYGSATYDLSWNGKLSDFNIGMNFGYFAGKLDSIAGEEYVFSRDEAIKTINAQREYILQNDLDDIQELEDRLDELETDLSIETDKIERIEINEEIDIVKNDIKNANRDMEKSKGYEILEQLKRLANSVDSVAGWQLEIETENGLIDDLHDIDCEFYDWVYQAGNVLNGRVELHFYGMVLANIYLDSFQKTA